jgi:hypothetical protein
VPVYPPAVFPYTRVSRHLQVAGILWVIYAFYRTLTKIAALCFLHGFLGAHFHNNWGAEWSPFGFTGLTALWPMILVSTLIGFALAAITGYALLTRQPWGRIFAIVTAILALFHPIAGTALSIYTLWLLAPAASSLEYQALTRSSSQP